MTRIPRCHRRAHPNPHILPLRRTSLRSQQRTIRRRDNRSGTSSPGGSGQQALDSGQASWLEEGVLPSSSCVCCAPWRARRWEGELRAARLMLARSRARTRLPQPNRGLLPLRHLPRPLPRLLCQPRPLPLPLPRNPSRPPRPNRDLQLRRSRSPRVSLEPSTAIRGGTTSRTAATSTTLRGRSAPTLPASSTSGTETAM
jgi:hypothetical protein